MDSGIRANMRIVPELVKDICYRLLSRKEIHIELQD